MSSCSPASVVLCRTQHPGNIGSVSRAMANFGYSRLFLVDPPTGWREDEALLNMANGHTEALDGAVVVGSLAELDGELGRLIGFTRRAGAHRPLRGDLGHAARDLALTRAGERAGLVFGNERTGLTGEELDRCDTLYAIASSPTHGSLNLALAAGLVLYQVALEAGAIQVAADGTEAGPADLISAEEAAERSTEILDTLAITGAFRPGKGRREDAEDYLRRMLMRARLTPFESGWLKRMNRRLRPYLRKEALPRRRH